MPHSNSSNPEMTYSYISSISTLHFEGFEDSLPDVNNYNNGSVICVRDDFSINTRFYVRLNNEWVYLNEVMDTRQYEDILVGYSGYGDEGLSTVSPDFNPVRVDDNLNIVRNDAHFKNILDDILVEIGVN